MTVRVGIIGIGFMGRMHFETYRRMKGARVAAICDVDAKKRSGDWSGIVGNIGAAGEKTDLKGVKVYSDAGRLMADPEVDVVDITLPTYLHSRYAVRALKAGAEGYLTKDSATEELVKAIRKILAGGRYVSPTLAEKLAANVRKDLTRAPHETLSDREYEIMCLIASGKTVTEIAGELSLSAKTISTHRTRILAKLGAKNSAAIVQYAIRNGLVI